MTLNELKLKLTLLGFEDRGHKYTYKHITVLLPYNLDNHYACKSWLLIDIGHCNKSKYYLRNELDSMIDKIVSELNYVS